MGTFYKGIRGFRSFEPLEEWPENKDIYCYKCRLIVEDYAEFEKLMEESCSDFIEIVSESDVKIPDNRLSINNDHQDTDRKPILTSFIYKKLVHYKQISSLFRQCIEN